MGFLGPEQPLLEELGVERDAAHQRQSRIRQICDEHAKACLPPATARRGQSLVVWAFNEGRGAARECDRYLMGRTNLP